MVPSAENAASYDGCMPRWSTSVGEALDVDPTDRTGPRRLDIVLAALLAVTAAAEIAFAGWEAPVLMAVASIVAVAVLPWRRMAPLATVLAAFAAQFAVSLALRLVRSDGVVEVTFGAGLAAIVLVYALCRWDEPNRVAVGLIGVAASTIGVNAIEGSLGDAWIETIPWAIVIGFALAMRYRSALRSAREREARLSERNDLARELHDSVAHHLTAIAVQTQAARYVAADNPQAAVDALPLIETSVRLAIDEMRQMVGILRSDEAMTRAVSSTSMLDFEDSVGQPSVTVRGDHDLAAVPASVAAAAYRITQEAITNARRHADGVTFIDVDCSIDAHRVELRIVNDGTPTTRRSGGGFGLVGMQERAEALGGTLEAGPHPSTGWSVAARLPLVQP